MLRFKILLLAIFQWGLLFSYCQAAEGVRNAGSYFSIGLGMDYQKGLYHAEGADLRLVVNGAYYFDNGFFLELPDRPDKFSPQIAAGYNFYNTTNWTFDALLSIAHGELTYRSALYDIEKSATAYIGARATGDVAGFQVQAIIAPITLHDDYEGGAYASLWVSKQWYIKNTQVYLSVGGQYRDASMLNYYYGTSELPPSEELPSYRAGSGINMGVQAGFSYPLSQSWVIDGYLSTTRIADSIIDSPYSQQVLAADPGRSDIATQAGFSISYVF